MQGMLIRDRLDLSIAGGQAASFSLGCPTSNPYVVSGGCGHRDFNTAQADIDVNYSGPDPDAPNARWTCRVTNRSNVSRAVVWFIVCSK